MIQRIDPGNRMSEASIHGGIAYLAGQVPETAGADIETQTREVLESIGRQLASLGSDPARILMATIYLVDMADYAGMNAVWDAWVPPGSAPSRACLQVAGLADPGWRIEIALTAAR